MVLSTMHINMEQTKEEKLVYNKKSILINKSLWHERFNRKANWSFFRYN